jgi:hypothetical protein
MVPAVTDKVSIPRRDHERVRVQPSIVMANGFPSGTSERIKTRLSPPQLSDHFAKQLADSGWVAIARSPAVHRVWTHPDSVGTEREMTLTITPSTMAGCQELTLQVRRVVKR